MRAVKSFPSAAEGERRPPPVIGPLRLIKASRVIREEAAPPPPKQPLRPRRRNRHAALFHLMELRDFL